MSAVRRMACLCRRSGFMDIPFGQKTQMHYFQGAYTSAAGMLSALTTESRPIVCQHETEDFMEMPVVAEHRKAMLQRAGRDPHIIGRNGTATASEFPVHGRILRRCLRVDDQLMHPVRRQKLLQFLAIGLCTRSDSKTAEQFA